MSTELSNGNSVVEENGSEAVRLGPYPFNARGIILHNDEHGARYQIYACPPAPERMGFAGISVGGVTVSKEFGTGKELIVCSKNGTVRFRYADGDWWARRTN